MSNTKIWQVKCKLKRGGTAVLGNFLDEVTANKMIVDLYRKDWPEHSFTLSVEEVIDDGHT
jgi:hypothetical protein